MAGPGGSGTHVRAGLLHGVGETPIPVGSPEWWCWLGSLTPAAVRIEDADPPYTARRERRGGAGFWYAYRRTGGVLRKAYLGRPAELTAERLHAVADELARDGPVPGQSVTRREATGAVRTLLRAHRLVTLVGPGGIGKSSLAVELARELGDPRRVVELVAVSDGALVAEVVRAALRLPDEPRRTAVETVAAALAGDRGLLVLDNCEHVAGEVAAFVTAMLTACPGLGFLATSRGRIGLGCEAVWPVPSMTVPAQAASAAAVLGTEAGRLFRLRARVADPAFAVTDATAAAVAQVCRAVDGIPLALELAASRLRVHSVDELARRLVDVFAALGEGDDRRHRLHAAIDWSHALLDERERALFARLAVFAGGWQLPEAEAVCAGGELRGPDVADALAGLLDRSLVQRLPVDADGERWFRLLEPLRQHAAERLRERGELDAVRDRHAARMVALAASTGPEQWYARRSREHARFDRYRDDLWAAWQRFVARGDVGSALRIAAALPLFWIGSIGVGEARLRLAELLALADRTVGVPADALLGALTCASILATAAGDLGVAEPVVERALALAGAGGDPAAEGFPRFIQVCVRWLRHDAAGAWDAATHAVAVADTTGQVGVAGMVRSQQVLAGLALGRPVRELAVRALAECEAAGYPLGVGIATGSLAIVALLDGEPERGRALVDRALAESDYLGGAPARLRAHLVGCWIELTLGDVGAAHRHATGAVDAVRHRLGECRLGPPLEALAQVAAARGDGARALRVAGAAAALRERCGIPAVSFERDQLERWTARAAAALGPAAAAAATAAGQALPLDEAVTEALGTVEEPSRDPDGERLDPLTTRQTEVARLVAAGMSNAEVAARLQLAAATVGRHLANAYLATGVRSRTQLAAWVSSRPRLPGSG